MIPIAPHLTAFFQQRLPVERNVSVHTSDSYARAFKMLLEYANSRDKVRPSEMHVEQLDAALGGPQCGNARCNIAGHDHSGGKSRRWRYILASGKTFDGEHLQHRVAFPPEGETGQSMPIMSV